MQETNFKAVIIMWVRVDGTLGLIYWQWRWREVATIESSDWVSVGQRERSQPSLGKQ